MNCGDGAFARPSIHRLTSFESSEIASFTADVSMSAAYRIVYVPVCVRS